MTEQEFTWHVLSVPNNIDFKRYRKRYDKTWLTKERKILRISEMSTSHIISCINMLERCNQEKTKSYRGLITEIQNRVDYASRSE